MIWHMEESANTQGHKNAAKQPEGQTEKTHMQPTQTDP